MMSGSFFIGAGTVEQDRRLAGKNSKECGDWKLMEFFEDHRLELYDLHNDLGETRNLADRMPEKVQTLHDKMIAWRNAIHAPMPTPNTNIVSRAKIRKPGKKDEWPKNKIRCQRLSFSC